MADVNIRTRLTGAKQVNSELAAIGTRVRSLASRFGALGGVLTIGGFALLSKRIIDAADQFSKLETRLGISTEALSQLEHAANLSGLQFNVVTLGLQRMTRRVAEAAQGTGEAQNAIKELRLEAGALAKLAPEKQLELFADALTGVKNPADQVRLAMKLFDSEGVAMLQMLKGGSKGLRDMRDEADRLGLTISKETAKQAADFNDSMTRLTASGRGAMIQFLQPILPVLTNFATRMSEASQGGSKFAFVGTAIAVSLKAVDSALVIATNAWKAYGTIVSGVAEALVDFVQGNFSTAHHLMKKRLRELGEQFDTFKTDLGAIWDDVEKEARDANEALTGLMSGTSGSIKDQNAAIKKLRDELQSLNHELIRLRDGDEAARQFELTTGALAEGSGELADSYRKQIVELDALIREQTAKIELDKEQEEGIKRIVQQFEEQEKQLAQVAQSYRESINPTEVYNKTIAELDDLRARGLITQREWNLLEDHARQAMRESFIAMVDLTTAQKAAAETKQDYNKALEDSARQWERAANPIMEYREELKRIDDALRRNLIGTKAYHQAVREAKDAYTKARQGGEEFTEWQKSMLRATEGFGQQFTESIDRMLSGAESSFKDFQQSIFSLFRKVIIQQYITKPLLDAVDEIIKGLNKAQGGGNFLSNIGAAIGGAIVGGGASAGGSGGAATTPNIALASGGVLPRGFTGLVGERGPELVTPMNASRVTPNHALGGDSIVINQTFQSGVTKAELAAIIPRIKADTIAAVAEAKKRGGKFSRVF